MTLVKCVVPWTQIEVCTTGFTRPCAEFNRDILDDNGNKFDLNNPDTDLYKVWNSADLKNIRQRFLDGEQLPECSKCWQQEQQGLLSRRERELDAHGKYLKHCTTTDANDPILLDVKLESSATYNVRYVTVNTVTIGSKMNKRFTVKLLMCKMAKIGLMILKTGST